MKKINEKKTETKNEKKRRKKGEKITLKSAGVLYFAGGVLIIPGSWRTVFRGVY